MSSKLTGLTAVTKLDDDALLYTVDVLDTTDDASGSSRKITAKNSRRRTAEITLDSAATDSGNTPTTTLRAKLCVARVTASGKYVAYDADDSGGAEIPVGFLVAATAVSGDTAADIYLSGEFDVSECPGLDLLARQILSKRGFSFREDATPDVTALEDADCFLGVSRKGTNYVLTAADHGKLFVATGAVSFTLPVKENGLRFDFVQTANNDLTISGDADIIAKNNATATSVAYSTSNQKIGARCRVDCVYTDTGTLSWVFSSFCTNTITVT